MEYIIFRMLRLIDREIEMYGNLYSCLVRQNDNILKANVLDLLVDMIDQKEMLAVISDIENDVKEEIIELTDILKIQTEEPNITIIVDALEHKYPKFCGFFKSKGKELDILLSKVDEINTQNISLLKKHKSIWKDIMPLYTAWKEFEPWWKQETEKEKEEIEELIYEFNLN